MNTIKLLKDRLYNITQFVFIFFMSFINITLIDLRLRIYNIKLDYKKIWMQYISRIILIRFYLTFAALAIFLFLSHILVLLISWLMQFLTFITLLPWILLVDNFIQDWINFITDSTAVMEWMSRTYHFLWHIIKTRSFDELIEYIEEKQSWGQIPKV